MDAMMKEWNKTTAMATDNLNSQGFAMEKNDIYMQSNEAKMKLLTAATETFWQNAVDSSVINGAVVALTKLVETFSFLINNPIASFLLTVAASTTALKLLGLGFTALGKSAVGVWAVKIATDGLGVSLKALVASPAFIFVATVAAIYLVIKATDALITTIDEQKAKVSELSSEYDNLKTSLTGLQDELTKTQTRIDELSNKKPITLVEQDELDKLKLANKELQVKIDLMNVETKNKAEQLGKETVKQYNQEFGGKEVSTSQIEYFQNKTPSAYQEGYSNQYQGGYSANPLYDTTDINSVIAAYRKFQKLKEDALKSGNNTDVTSFNKTLEDISKQLLISSTSLVGMRENLRSLPNPTEEEKKAIDKINNSLKFTRSILLPDQLFGEAWKSLNKDQQDVLTTANKSGTLTEEQIKKYQALNDILGINGFSFEKLKSYIESTTKATDDQGKAVDTLTSSYEEAQKSFETQTTALKELYSYQTELNSENGLSAKSMEDIISKHAELLPYLSDEKELRKQLTSIITQEEDTQKSAYANMMINSEDFFNAKIKGNTDLVNELNSKYGIDLNNYKSLAQAKSAVESKLLGDLAGKWSKYYSAATGALNAEGEQAFSQMGATQGMNMRKEFNAYSQKMKGISDAFSGIVFNTAPIDFKKINLGSSSSSSPKSSSSPSQTDPTKYDLNLDRYMSLNNILAQINNELELNNSLQDSASNSDKIKLLEQRNILLEKQKNALHSLAEEQRAERDELARGIKYNGIGIDTNGNVTNADVILQSMTNSANKMAEGNAKKARFDNIKNIQDDVKRYADLVTSEIPKTSSEWLTSQNAIQDNIKAIGDLQVAIIELAYTQKQTAIDYEASVSQGRQHSMTEGSADYVAQTNIQIGLYKLKQDALHVEAEALRGILATQIEGTAEYQNTLSKINSASLAWLDLNNQILDSTESVKNFNNQIETDTLGKMKDLKKQQYEEEKTAYDDLIDHKIKRLDDLQAKEDYDKNINKQDIAIAKKKSEIDALYGDNSVAGMTKKAEFEAQLLDLKTAKQDTVDQHNLDSQKAVLQKQKDNSDAYFDEKLKDTNLQYQVEQDLQTKNVEELKTIYGGLWDSFDDNISKLGKSLKTNFIDQLIKAKGLLDAPSDMGNTFSQMLSNKQQWTGSNPEKRNALANDSIRLASTLPSSLNTTGIAYPDMTVAQFQAFMESLKKNGIITFASGGYTADSQGMAWLDKKELILNSIDTSNLLKTIDISRQIIGSMNMNKIPNISNNTNNNKSVTLTPTFNIYANNGDSSEQIANTVLNVIANKLDKIGK